MDMKPIDAPPDPALSWVSAPSHVEQADVVHARLEARLADARAALLVLDEERRSLAFAAHTEGGDAERKLTALNKRRQLLVADVETLEAALIEASRRVADAEHEAAQADAVLKARRALEIAAGLVERAQKMDAALAILAEEAIGYKGDIDTLNFKLGISHPSAAQFQAAATRALRTAIVFTALRDCIEFIAPGERRSMLDMAQGHAAAIERQAGPQLPSMEAAE